MSGLASRPSRRRMRIMKSLRTLPRQRRERRFLWVIVFVLACSFHGTAVAQAASAGQNDAVRAKGTVCNSAGEPVADATVLIQEKVTGDIVETKTLANGSFVAALRRPGSYTVSVQKSGWHTAISEPLALSAGDDRQVKILLQRENRSAVPTHSSCASAMAFDDQ